jgi:hypothetical protein
VRPPAGRLDPRRDRGEVVGGARGDHHVRTGLGQRDGGRRPDAPAGSGDHGDLVPHREPIEDHGRKCNTF